MTTLALPWRELLIAILGLAVAYLLWLRLAERRAASPGRDRLTVLEAEVARLNRRITVLEMGATGAPPTPPSAPVQAPESTYDTAARLARQGLMAQEIAERCRISLGEAELLIALGRQQSGE